MQSLAILIPTIEGREFFLERLIKILQPQLGKYKDNVQVFILKDNREQTTGEKRNVLTQLAITQGFTHRCFIDDDDTITDDYLDLNMPGVMNDYDCNSLVGIYSLNGYTDPKKHIFIHSLRYDKWFEDDTHYYRNPNHLNVIKLSCIKDIPFPDKVVGEDGIFSERLFTANALHTEWVIDKPFYNYLSRTKHNGI